MTIPAALPEPTDPSGAPGDGDEQAYATLDRAMEALPTERQRRLAREMGTALADLFHGGPTVGDLKITRSTLTEMGEAFEMFAPFRDVPKVSIFGSARTQTDDPLYDQARRVAADLADDGWMVVTGAGPGIMHAAMEGAGRERSIGVSIRLPFEQGANAIIAGDAKYVSMKYFFTRKLMLVKESRGFVCLPGGFGTLDETFELLTLTQTGKGAPVPIVLLDTPGDQYWETVHDFIEGQLVKRGLVAAADTKLYLVTDDHRRAADEIRRFYANYQSLRYVGDMMVMRLRHEATDEHLEVLNSRFGHLCKTGSIVRASAFEPEVRDRDHVDLPRIALTFARHGYGELRSLIDTLNGFVPWPVVEQPPAL